MIKTSIHHSRTVISILVLLLIAGAYSYVHIAKESSPDIDIPQIFISMVLDGISPDDAERLLLRPMEQDLASIEGVKEMKSTGYQGGGYVLLEFQAGFDKDKALDDVQKAVDQARPDLPEDVEEPTVTETNLSLFPVLVVTLSSSLPERALLKLAHNLRDRIETISSVLDVNIAGNRDELVEVIIDPELLESYGLKGIDILNIFRMSNRLVAAGNLNTRAGRFAIKVPGLFETANEIMNMPLRVNEDSVIKVSDVSEIRRTFKDPDSIARLHGERAIAVEVVKRSGENIIDTVKAVRKVVAEESAFWPEGIEVSFTQDESETIETMLLDLRNNVISAILLVMIVVVFALGIRTGTLVGIAIPGAFLTGIFVIYAMGLTVNIVVLFTLTLSIGMLVDGAIVVTEYADRKLTEGIPRDKAYAEAGRRMAWPIISSTATTLAAFGPLLFWPDMVGEFMKFMPITLIAVLASSMLMALIFVPTLGALYGKPGAASDPKMMQKLVASEEGNLKTITGFTGWYISVLEVALKRPGRVLLLALAMLVGVQFAYLKLGKGIEFFPSIEPDFASVLVHARGNLSIYEQDELVKDVEDRILNVDGIKTMYTRIGKSQKVSDLAEDVIGQIQIEFTDWDTRKPAREILNEIRDKTGTLAGIFIEAREQKAGPAGGKAVEIQIASRFPEKLEPVTVQVLDILEELGDFRDVEDTRPLPGIEWELEVDRAQAAKFGMNITTIGYYIRMVTNGLKVAAYRPDDSEDEIDIVVRHGLEQRTLDQLDRIHIEGAAGSVPISSFVTRSAQPAVGVVYRSDQRRIVTVKADLPPGINVNAKVEKIKGWLSKHRHKLDPEVAITFKGQDEEQRDSEAFLIRAFIIALFIMAMILVTQFNSFYSAFLILTAVIMSTIGVMIGLIVTGQQFGIVMTGVGIIALAGIIVNNNIVLIDTFDHLNRQYGKSMNIREIILRTGAQRLRPVLLTTITTVIGLLPMVLQLNIDFISRKANFGAPSTQWWVQLSTAIVFGLTFSTVLTLVVTPSALMWRENIATTMGNLNKRLWKFIYKENSSLVPGKEK